MPDEPTAPATGEPPAAPAAPRPRRRWPTIAAVVALVLVAVVVTAMTFIHVPYVIISPGDATALDNKVITISGAPTYRHHGDLLYLTVQVSNEDPNLWRYLFAQLDDDVSVEKRQNVIGCAGYGENASLNEDLMGQSQNVAKQVALTRLGYPVTTTGGRAVIVDVQCGGPSEGRLHLADVITAVDGKPVAKSEDVRPLILAHKPGDTVRVTVRRDGGERDIEVRLGEKDGAPLLGIATQTFANYTFPVDVKIDTARVSGPSAGLAFTLAIIDNLTPGDLTGGKKVAITGEIEPDGSVGPVGGVEQKTVAARQNGAKLMIVPVGEAAGARAHANGMKIVAVHNLDDALAALAKAGGDPVPPAKTTSAAPATAQ